MKQETKNRLIKCSKIAMIIGGILLWLVSFIGISAYSVYWLRQNANYESENIRDLKPKQLNNDENFYGYKVKSLSSLQRTLNYDNNTYGYKTYFDLDYNNFPQEDTVPYAVVYFYADFNVRINGQNVIYDYCEFDFEYSASSHDFQLTLIQLASRGSSSFNIYKASDSTYNDVVVLFSGVRVYANHNLLIKQDGYGLFNFYFDKVFDLVDSYTYTFQSGPTNLPQYLRSYNRMQYGLIQYSPLDTNTDFLRIPMVFECNGILYDSIIIVLSTCWYYFNSAGQVVDTWATTPTGTMTPYVCSYVLFGYYGKTCSWTFDDTGLILSSVSNGSLAMYLGYNGFSYQDDTNPSFWAPNYLVVQGLQVVADYQTIHVMNVDSVPFPNNIGSNLKPYNNITIRSILTSYFNFYGDVNGYNGVYYDVGLGSVFILLSDAFKSFIPLLAIQIIPGITLGLLVMLPLVVTIILVIIKLVKK